MTIRYSRSVGADAPPGAVDDATAEVRAQLSATADYDDDPDTHADLVRVWTELDDEGTTKVLGQLEAEPDAPYLREGFNPDADQEFSFTRYSEDGQE